MKLKSFRTRMATVQYEDVPTLPHLPPPPQVLTPVPRSTTHIFLQLQTDNGLEGIGYLSSPTAGLARLKSFVPVIEAAAESILGLDADDIDAIHKHFRGRTEERISDEALRCLTVIDIALWDIRGKAAGLPVHKLLGATRDRVPAYASWKLWPSFTLDELAENGRSHVKAGFRAMKYRLGGVTSAAQAAERTRHLRQAVGDEIDLMVDSNGSWTVEEGLEIGQALEEFKLYWIEDPLLPAIASQTKQLTDALSTTVTAGETFRDISQFKDALDKRSIDIAMIDLGVGGITEWVRIAEMVKGYNLPVVSHLATEVSCHVVASQAHGAYVEYWPPARPLFKEPLQMEDGMLVLPGKPGLGLELDESAMKHFATP